MSKVSFSIEDAKFTPYLQDSIIYLMISDTEFLEQCSHLFRPKVFEHERRYIAEACYEYFSKYREAPESYILDVIYEYLEKLPSQRKLVLKYLDKVLAVVEPNREYVRRVFGDFVKRRIAAQAIEDAKELVDKGDVVRAEEVILDGLRQAQILKGEVLVNYLQEGLNATSTDFRELNYRTYIEPYDDLVGGRYRKEFVLLFGDQNVGKSWACIHEAKVALVQGRKVLYITLETDKELVKQRFSMAFTGLATDKATIERGTLRSGERTVPVKPLKASKIRASLDLLRRKNARLWIEQPISFNLNDLRNMVNRLEVTQGEVPDVVIIDSPDQMDSLIRHRDQQREIKELYKGLLAFTKERGCTLLTTTQAGRQAAKKKVTRGDDVSDSYDKIRIPDTVLILSQSPSEYEKNVCRMLHWKSRGATKFKLYEISQAIGVGQFCMDAKIVKRNLDEASDVMKKFKKVIGDD